MSGRTYIVAGYTQEFRDVWSAWDFIPLTRGALKPLSLEEANKRLAPHGYRIDEKTAVKEVA